MHRVIGAPIRDGLPSKEPRDAYKGGIEDRNGEDEHRNEGRVRDSARSLHAQSKHRQHVAEDEASAVAHENASGGDVEDEKASGGPGEHGGRNGLSPEPLHPCHDGEEHRRKDGDARRHAIHRVEQVEGICQPEDPDDRQWSCYPDRGARSKKEIRGEHEGRTGHLRRKLRDRPEPPQVVNQTRNKEESRTAPDLHREGRETATERQNHCPAHKNGDAPQERRRRVVPLFRLRDRHPSGPAGNPPNDRGQPHRREERETTAHPGHECGGQNLK
jgi:hypothetical protein